MCGGEVASGACGACACSSYTCAEHSCLTNYLRLSKEQIGSTRLNIKQHNTREKEDMENM
jgi:Na+-translocating ferredoxin:NAD+ oxidoreductase RnfC subunit